MGITTLLSISVIVLCFIFSVKKPIAGVMAYLIVYIVYNPDTWYGYQLQSVLFRPSLLAALVLIISCLINYKTLNWNISRREIEIYVFVFTAFAVSYLSGFEVDAISWQYISKMMKLCLLLFFFLRAVNSIKDLNFVIWTLIAGGIFLCWQVVQIGFFYDGRLNNIGGTDFSEANAFGSYLIFCVILLGFKLFDTALWKNLWKKILIVIPIGLLVNTFVMTQSRAVFIGLSVAFLFLILKTPKKIKVEFFLYSFLALILFGFLTHDKFWERMGTIQEESTLINENDQMGEIYREVHRIDFWRTSLDIFRDHPMGIGVKNFQDVVKLYDPRNPGMDAHNTYVLCYTEIGIIGIVLFLLIIFEALMQLKRTEAMIEKHKLPLAHQMILFSFLTFLIVFLTGPMVTHSYLYTEFTWILLSLPICLENAIRNSFRSEILTSRA